MTEYDRFLAWWQQRESRTSTMCRDITTADTSLAWEAWQAALQQQDIPKGVTVERCRKCDGIIITVNHEQVLFCGCILAEAGKYLLEG